MNKTREIMKKEIVEKIQNIINNSLSIYQYEIKTNDWVKGDNNRTYIFVTETSNGTKHYKKHDFGYIDNITNTYVAGKCDANDNFTLDGRKF